MNFRTKTILGVAAIETVLLAILVGNTLSVLRESNEGQLARRAQLGARLLAVAAKDAVIAEDLATLDSLTIEAMNSREMDYVRILDAQGNLLAQQGDAALWSRPFRADLAVDQAVDGILDWSTPVEAGGIRFGEVRIGVSTDFLTALLRSSRNKAAGVAGLGMLLVGVFSWLLGSYLLRQLNDLRRASARIALGDFAYRVPVKGDDELAQTAIDFNRMAGQLGENRILIAEEQSQRIAAQRAAELAQYAAQVAQLRAEDHAQQLNSIFATSPNGIVSFNTECCVQFANPAFLAATGYTNDEILGMGEDALSERLARDCKPWAVFVGIAALRSEEELTAAAINDGASPDDKRPQQRHLIELVGSGKPLWEASLRVSDGAAISQTLHLRDVTHEVALERMKSEFLAHAAHELRNPMASIYGFTELLLQREVDDDTRKDLLSIIYRQSERMVAIINELLDLSRIEEGGGKDFFIEAVPLGRLLDETLAALNIDAGLWQFGVEMPDALPPVRADAAKLRQVLNNVLGNAIKYSPSGSRIEVRGCMQEKGGRRFAGIAVTDHGIGMTPEQLARVGERFYRADASGSIPGTGLGVSIVKEIIGLMGGLLEIDSKFGTGSTFTIWLPVDSGICPPELAATIASPEQVPGATG